MPPEITTGLFTLAGVLLGALIGKWSMENISRQNARNAAASSLRASFAPHRFSLRPDTCRTVGKQLGALQKDVALHTVEMEKFRTFVASKKQPAYDKACQEYVDVVTVRLDAIDGASDPANFLREHIDAVLAFAEP